MTNCIQQKVLSSSNPAHLTKPKFVYELFFTHFLKDGMVVSDVPVWSPHRQATERAFYYKSLVTYLEFISQEGLAIVKNALSNLSFDGYISNEWITETIENHAVKIISREWTAF